MKKLTHKEWEEIVNVKMNDKLVLEKMHVAFLDNDIVKETEKAMLVNVEYFSSYKKMGSIEAKKWIPKYLISYYDFECGVRQFYVKNRFFDT